MVNFKSNTLAFFFIFSIALVLRLNGIFWGMPNETHPLNSYHPDEHIVASWAEQLYSANIQKTHFEYGGTLYLSFIRGCSVLSTQLADMLPGYNALANYLIVTRIILVLISLGSIYLLYVITAKLYDRNFAMLAALFLAVTPAHVIWAQRVRVDEIATFMALLIFYFSIQIFQHRSVITRDWFFVAVSVGAATALRAPLLLFAIAPLVAFKLSPAENTELNIKDGLRVGSLYGVAIVLSYSFFSPHSWLYFDKFIDGLMLQRYYQTSVFVDAVGLGPIGWQYVRYMFPQALGWPFYGGFLIALVYLIRFPDKRAQFVLFSALPYLLLTAFASWVVVRYTLPLLPFIILILIACLHSLQSTPRFKKFIMPGSLALAVITVSLLLPFQTLNTGHNIRDEVYDWMSTEIPSGSEVLSLRAYGSDVFFEPNFPKGIQRSFVRYPLNMQCDRCYESWQHDYIVLADPLLGNLDRLKTNYPHPEMLRFNDWLQETHDLLQQFEKPPVWFGINIQSLYSSHDLNYSNPSYRIYRKKSS